MEVVIGDLVGFVFNNIYTSTALQGRQWKIFQQGKIEGLITFCTELQITKNPAGARFFQGFAVGCRRTHCVTSTQKVYAIEDERAIPARILTFLNMDRLPDFVHKILYIRTVFIYTEGVRSERGGRSSTGATKSWLKRVVPSVP